jgi:hypothetical protein
MPDLLWAEAKNFFDPDLMGALPDICVPDASTEDWQAIFDLVKERGWQWQYSQGDTVLPLPSAAEVLDRPDDAETVELRVWPTPRVLAIFRPTSANEIEFDVDLRELQGQEGVDILCGLLNNIGRKLGKPVLMTPEGERNPAHAVLGFDPAANRVVLLADPSLS